MFNKNSLAREVQSVLGGSNVQAEGVVETVLASIRNAVMQGEKVSLAGFGIFIKKEVKAKQARNPATGEKVQVRAHSKVKFTPAKSFKEFIN